MDYSLEQINKIEEYAGYLMKISDMAALMELDPDELKRNIRQKKTLVSKAYRRGKALTTLTLRKQEIELARVGSPLAVQLTSSYLLEMNDDEDL